MKLDCPRKDFNDAVTMAASAASQRTSVNILQNLKVEAGDSGIRVLGCDGEMWVERDVACMVSETGALCLQASVLKELVNKLPDGDVQLYTLDGNGAMLKEGAAEYRLQTLDAEDFPPAPNIEGESELTLKFGDFKAAVDSVVYAVSTDQHRQILTGVLFTYNGQTLTLVATDTHRLAVKRLQQPGIGANVTAVVPEKALRAIKSLPVGDDSEIVLRFGAGRMGVEAGGAKVITQLLSGAYPNWERVVPTEFTRTWSVETDQLAERVERTMVLARDNANRVRFKGDDGQIMIAARSEEKGEAKEEVPMVSQDGDIEIAFNGKYVMDALKAIHDTGVRIEMTESSRPAVFRPAEDSENYFCVIMPMALA
ncbi:MAG TPA: DNA polymerase III subunit beta [Fimbriimonadaceae bacterium]|nr:DNA polymerase III subunit beta [Fimbriimonadaceae bacterium]